MSARGDDAARAGVPARELLPTATPREAARALLALARPHLALTLGAALALLGAAVAALLVPPLLGAIVDAVLDRDGIEPYVLGLAAAAVVQALLTGVGRQLTAKLGETVLAELREQVVERALAIPAARLERAGSGDLLSRRLQRRRDRLDGDPDRRAGAPAGRAVRRPDAVRAGRAEPMAGAGGAPGGADPAARAAPLPQARRAALLPSARAGGRAHATPHRSDHGREDLARARARAHCAATRSRRRASPRSTPPCAPRGCSPTASGAR